MEKVTQTGVGRQPITGGGIVSKGALTREQFDAAELLVRREMAARLQVFDPEELRLLDYWIERSFRLGRSAAYFRSFRQLGAATRTFSHAQEALKRLINKKVLAALPLTTSRWHWYGFNLRFLDWPREQTRPAEFWEEPALPFEPELDEMLRHTFIEFSAGSLAVVATSETDRERDAVSAPVPHAEKGAPGLNAPARPTSGSDSKTQAPPVQCKPDWERLKKAITTGRVEEEFPEIFRVVQSSVDWAPGSGGVPSQGTDGPKAVPSQGTKVYPSHPCTPAGYADNPNVRAAKARAVPSQGTYPYIASSASVQKAELAVFAAVPLQGTESFNDKVALAWGYLQKIDLTDGLKVKRFYEQWQAFCKKNPDWILKIAPHLIERQVELHGSVPKPLALLAHIARQEKKMR